jgi:hypothetical protein
VRRLVRYGTVLGVGAAVAIGLRQAWRWFQEMGTPPPPASWPKVPVPVDEAAQEEEPSTAGGPVVAVTSVDEPAPDDGGIEPVDGTCPGTHPVKVKVRSGLFHLPGMSAYERTLPDRCFVDEAAAEAAGFTRAKR